MREMDRLSQKVAVVIVNWNSGPLLDACLRALDRQTVTPKRVIVVDNASGDGSGGAPGPSRANFEVIRLSENIGFAAANNLAISRLGDCEWVALLNPDAFPSSNWLESLLAAARDRPEYSFFASHMVKAHDPAILDGTGDVFHISGLAWRAPSS